MSDEIPFAILTALVLIVAAFARPVRVHAPRGFYVEGVRPTGETTLRAEPVDDNTPGRGAIGARIYCTNGTRPIVVDERTVGCQPGGF